VDWQPTTDGGGYTLSIVDPLADRGTWGDAASWKASGQILGSPGAGDLVLGDTDSNGTVDVTDLNNVRNNFGGLGLGDADGDGDVDVSDLNAVRNNFGASVNSLQTRSLFANVTIAASSLPESTSSQRVLIESGDQRRREFMGSTQRRYNVTFSPSALDTLWSQLGHEFDDNSRLSNSVSRRKRK